MSPTIKGPMKFENSEEMFGKIKDKVKIKLPFSATGWRSTKNAQLVKGGKKATTSELLALRALPTPVLARTKKKIKKGGKK